MADTTEKVPIHPVAPRLKSGPKKPHVGPDIHGYRSAHKETVGHESDKWWAKVKKVSRGRSAGISIDLTMIIFGI